MFIVILNYLKPLEKVDEKRGEHLTYISNYVLAGKFITVGRQKSSKGGIIIAHNIEKEELENILKNDPYHTNGLADYNIIEFNPGMYAQGIEETLEKLQ